MHLEWIDRDIQGYINKQKTIISYPLTTINGSIPSLDYHDYRKKKKDTRYWQLKIRKKSIVKTYNIYEDDLSAKAYYYKHSTKNGTTYKIQFLLGESIEGGDFISFIYLKHNDDIRTRVGLSLNKLGANTHPLEEIVSKDEFTANERHNIGELLFSQQQESMILAAQIIGLFNI